MLEITLRASSVSNFSFPISYFKSVNQQELNIGNTFNLKLPVRFPIFKIITYKLVDNQIFFLQMFTLLLS